MKNSRADYRCWSGKIRFMAISDTSPEIEAMQARIHERMSAEQRLLMALEMSYFTHELARQGLRDAHPDWSEERVRREFLLSLFPPGAAPSGL
jgi:putative alpha-1,2-mannosidase